MTMSAKHLLVALTILAATPAVPQAAQTETKPAAVTLASQQRAEEDKQLLGLIALTAAPLLPPVMAQDHPPATPGPKKPTVAQASPQHEDDGQRIFEQNCSRCHNAPEGFSPSISGTIVRHMRVRASLSKHDEEQLLHFFNP
jgi:mono/diheme cytochrome c family protein